MTNKYAREMLFVLFVYMVIGALASLFIFQALPTIFSSTEKSSKQNILFYGVDIGFGCSDMKLNDTVYCLRNWVKTFYNYTLRDENNYTGSQGTLEDIKQNGGDCYDYSNIYNSSLAELGFNTKIEKIYPDDSKQGHAFVIAWNKNLTEYCNLDMVDVVCWEFEK